MSPKEVLAAFRGLGHARPLEANRFRFAWSPVLAPFAGERETATPGEADSMITPSAEGWRWELDPNPLATGRVLWRMANALRLLTLLSLMVEQNAVESWCALYRDAVLAAHDGPKGERATVVTERFAELIAGELGKTAFLAVAHERFVSAIRSEDEATLASQRDSALIAAFVEDQLAVRPPITQAEVDECKRRLGSTNR